jgi:hypothetical protein
MNTPEYHKAYREANREALLAKEKAYREANREALRARSAAYAAAHPEAVRAAKLRHYHRNRERYQELRRRYAADPAVKERRHERDKQRRDADIVASRQREAAYRAKRVAEDPERVLAMERDRLLRYRYGSLPEPWTELARLRRDLFNIIYNRNRRTP